MWRLCSTPVGTRSSLGAGTTALSELLEWHSHILNFDVAEKGPQENDKRLSQPSETSQTL